MHRRCLLSSITCSAALLLSAANASAGSYTVVSCAAAADGANRSWSSSSNNSDVPSYGIGCPPAAGGALIARAAALPGGGTVPGFAAAVWAFDSPPGTTIDRLDISLWMYRYGGGASDRWGVGVGDESGNYLLGGIGQTALAEGARGSYFAVPVANRSGLRLGVVCANGAGCNVKSTDVAAAGYSRARVELYGARVQINDPSPASISNQAGALWSSSGWLSGDQSLSFTASDAVGIAKMSGSLGGESHTSEAACDFTLSAPCPASRSYSASFDTRGVADGRRSVTIEAVDAGGNRRSESHVAQIDNNGPDAPGAPELSGDPPEQWRTVNSFTLHYANPPQGDGSPLSSHDLQICSADQAGVVNPADCTTEARSGAPGVDVLSVPGVGSYRARLRVNDTVMNGKWGVWSPMLRFDDTAPGTPAVVFPEGWVNRAQIATALTLRPPFSPTARPPSGYASYRLTIDDGAPLELPASGAGSTAAFDLSRLTDGRHRLAVTVVTGAGLVTPPLSAASGELLKDVVAPTLTVTGAPKQGAFVTTPVTLRAAASDAISGMAAAIAPAQVTSGGYIWSQINRDPGLFTGGGVAALTTGEGDQLVQLYASDVAGNHSSVQSFSYTQDTGPPRGGLRPIDPAHPSLLDFFVEERCLKQATVELSTTPGNWQPLPTQINEQRVTASVPTTVWQPRTPYTTRLSVADCAGNSALLDRWYGGADSGGQIGLITPPAREAVVTKAALASVPSGAASSATLRRVSVKVSDPLGRPLRELVVRLEVQPRMTPASWVLATAARTDANGAVALKLRPHSSLRIRAVVPGSELREEGVSNIVYALRRASTTISAKPRLVRRGKHVTISGRLRGGYLPRLPLELALYGLGPRSRGWVPVRTTVKVSAAGYWKASYRFVATRTRSRFKFRVRIPARPDYPFLAAMSHSVGVTVAP